MYNFQRHEPAPVLFGEQSNQTTIRHLWKSHSSNSKRFFKPVTLYYPAMIILKTTGCIYNLILIYIYCQEASGNVWSQAFADEKEFESSRSQARVYLSNSQFIIDF